MQQMMAQMLQMMQTSMVAGGAAAAGGPGSVNYSEALAKTLAASAASVEGATGADSPVLVSMPSSSGECTAVVVRELRDGTYESAVAAATETASAGMIPFVAPRVELLPCNNCKELLCCCMPTEAPRCIDTCTGCVEDTRCHNNPSDVQRKLREEHEARKLVEATGIAGIQSNIMSGRPSGMRFPPSYDPLCIPTKSIETCIVGISGAPKAGSDGTDDVPINGRRRNKDKSLFEFFAAHPEQVEGHRDGKHGRVACFYIDLSPSDTKEMFMSHSERTLISYNCGQFPPTDHAAQHPWESRSAHAVFREITLLGHSPNLPGKWAPTVTTAMPDVPAKMFEAYVSTLESADEENDTDPSRRSLEHHHDATRQTAMHASTGKPVEVTTTTALTHLDLAAHSNANGGWQKPYADTSVDTLTNQELAADIVRPDEHGFRSWSNCNNTKYWAVQHIGSSMSTSASARTHATDDDTDSDADDVETPRYGTNLGDKSGVIHPSPARDSRLVARFTKNSLAHLIHAAYITHYGMSTSAPVPVYEGFTSNCYLQQQIAYQDLDYESLLTLMSRQLHESATNFRLTATEPFSCLEIASPNCTYKKDATTRVQCASSNHSKFVIDVMLPHIREKVSFTMTEVELLNTERSLRAQLVTNEDISHMFQAAQLSLYTELKAMDDAKAAEDKANAEGAVMTQRPVPTAWKLPFLRRTKRSIEVLMKPDQAKSIVRDAVNRIVLQAPKKTGGKADHAQHRVRVTTFHANRKQFLARIDQVASVNELCVMITKDMMTTKTERFQTLNNLFNIGCAHTWIDETDQSLKMFINYVDVVRYCVSMVTGFRWWTTCADLRKGLRVSFEWADGSISLSAMLRSLEDKVWRKVSSARHLTHAKPIDSFPSLSDVLRNAKHPEYHAAHFAIERLAPEDRAWFEPSRFTTSWKIHYTPIWKHVVMLHAAEAGGVGGAAAGGAAAPRATITDGSESSSSSTPAGVSSSTEGVAAVAAAPLVFENPEQKQAHEKLVAEFGEKMVLGVRAEFADIWDMFPANTRADIIRVFVSKRR